MTLNDRAEEFLALFDAVNRGWIPIVSIIPCHTYPIYELATGHKIKVFNDAGDWDYIEGYSTPQGEYIDFWGDGSNEAEKIEEARHVEPTNEMVWRWEDANRF